MAKILTFKDNFRSGTIGAQWDNPNSITVTSGMATFASPFPSFNKYIASAVNYDLTDSEISWQIPNIVYGDNDSFAELGIRDWTNGNNVKFNFYQSGATYGIEGEGVTWGSPFLYSSGMWFRIRHNSGTGLIYSETSTDRTSWTVRGSATPAAAGIADLTNVRAEFNYYPGNVDTGYMYLDNVNTDGQVIRFVQGASGAGYITTANTTTASVTLNGVKKGNLIVIGAGFAGMTTPVNPQDNLGNSYSVYTNFSPAPTHIYRCIANADGNLTFSVSATTVSNVNLVAQEFNSDGGSLILDKQVQAGSSSSSSSGDSGNTATTSSADELLVAVVKYNYASTVTVGTNYSNLTTSTTAAGGGGGGGSSIAMQSRIMSSTGAYNATATFSPNTAEWGISLQTFMIGSAGGGNMIMMFFP